MTDDQTIGWGLKAEALLRDDNYNDLYALVQEHLGKEVLTTPITEKEYREQLYLIHHGMRSFADRLTQMVMAKNAVIERINKQNAQDNNENDPDELDLDF